MPGIVVVGLQWGDEGKGKVVDLLSENASHIVRSQGGNNAGHTIQIGEKELALHLIPSGVLHPHVQCYITGGCLIDPKVLWDEIQKVEAAGASLIDRLHLSPHAHVIFPFHRQQDSLEEEQRGEGRIGTTGRGIGPCVADRALRLGLRLCELTRPDILSAKLELLAKGKDPISSENMQKIYEESVAFGELLLPFMDDAEGKIRAALLRDETVLFEGAHGTLLDGVFGSYPFVTSSSTSAAGVCAGAGVSPLAIDEVVGVLKAYTTRVGEGPLPTAVDPDTFGEFQSCQELRETGTTTGRERRIGWLDLVLGRHAAQMNGVTQLVITKLDVLDRFEEIHVCVGYELQGKKIDFVPALAEDLFAVEPIYETFPGWESSTKDVRSIRGLPENARRLIEAIEDVTNIPVSMVSVGPDRGEMIESIGEWM